MARCECSKCSNVWPCEYGGCDSPAVGVVVHPASIVAYCEIHRKAVQS